MCVILKKETIVSMNASDRELCNKWKDEIEVISKTLQKELKHTSVYVKYLKPLNVFLSLLSGTAGSVSLVACAVAQDPNYMMLFQGCLLLVHSFISAEDLDTRMITLTKSSNDCTDLLNYMDLILHDADMDQHDVIQAMVMLMNKKTLIENEAPI